MNKEAIIVVVVVCCFFVAFIAICINNHKSESKTEKRFKEIASDNVFNKPIYLIELDGCQYILSNDNLIHKANCRNHSGKINEKCF